MPAYKSIMDLSKQEWLAALALPEEEIPDIVIVEGSWWRAQRTEWRLGYLEDVRELAFPDMFWGRWKEKKVAFSCAYGAPRTVEVVHLFAVLGARLAVQIGTCGGLQPFLKTGAIILPDVAICRDGVAHLYGFPDAVRSSTAWTKRAAAALKTQGHTTYPGAHMTWSSLFTETAPMIEAWHQAGYLSVDMETATTFAVARSFDVPAVSMLVVWDDLLRGKRFLDPLGDQEQRDLDAANASVYEAALALAEQLPP